MKLPQLSLRDLFWLVLVAAILCLSWVERTKRLEADARAKAMEADKVRFQSETEEYKSVLTQALRRIQELRESSVEGAQLVTPAP
jgi:hypothetical protein